MKSRWTSFRQGHRRAFSGFGPGESGPEPARGELGVRPGTLTFMTNILRTQKQPKPGPYIARALSQRRGLVFSPDPPGSGATNLGGEELARFPMPAPPPARRQSAFDEVCGRTGITVDLHRRANRTVWAVHHANGSPDGELSFGPKPGEDTNMDNTSLAKRILREVRAMSPDATVYVTRYELDGILRSGAGMSVSHSAPPAQSRQATSEAIRSTEQRLISTITLSTDASKGSTNAVGCGWVIDYASGLQPYFGRHSRIMRGGILAGELLAIKLGLRDIAKRHEEFDEGSLEVVVRSDSTQAIGLISSWASGMRPAAHVPGTTVELVREIAGMVKGRQVSFEWVRGHSGDPANESADRLAIAARRNLEFGASGEVAESIMSNIRAECRELMVPRVAA